MTLTDRRREAIELMTRATSLLTADTPSRSPLPLFAAMVPPGAELHAGQRADGTWDYYLVMPSSWRPRDVPGERRWLSNPATGRLWDSGHAATEHEALGLGLLRLIEAVRP